MPGTKHLPITSRASDKTAPPPSPTLIPTQFPRTLKLTYLLGRFLLQARMVKMSLPRFGPVAGLITLLSLATMAAAQDVTYCASFNTADGNPSKLSLAYCSTRGDFNTDVCSSHGHLPIVRCLSRQLQWEIRLRRSPGQELLVHRLHTGQFCPRIDGRMR